jgi:hypothetical protein
MQLLPPYRRSRAVPYLPAALRIELMNVGHLKKRLAKRLLKLLVAFRWRRSLSRNLLPADFPLGAWSMLPDDFVYLERYIERQTKPELLVAELGSGSSTVFLCKLFARLGKKVSFYSFEAEPEWLSQTQELLEKYCCEGCVVQLTPHRSYGDYFWFDTAIIKDSLNGRCVDILIVDAPPDTLGTFARRPALDVFWPYLLPDSLVLLHDTNRTGESQIAREWSENFRQAKTHNTEKGLTAFWGAVL